MRVAILSFISGNVLKLLLTIMKLTMSDSDASVSEMLEQSMVSMQEFFLASAFQDSDFINIKKRYIALS